MDSGWWSVASVVSGSVVAIAPREPRCHDRSGLLSYLADLVLNQKLRGQAPFPTFHCAEVRDRLVYSTGWDTVPAFFRPAAPKGATAALSG